MEPIRYRNVIAILKNPFYAGVYVYGKSEKPARAIERWRCEGPESQSGLKAILRHHDASITRGGNDCGDDEGYAGSSTRCVASLARALVTAASDRPPCA
jgi:hypothetical protein